MELLYWEERGSMRRALVAEGDYFLVVEDQNFFKLLEKVTEAAWDVRWWYETSLARGDDMPVIAEEELVPVPDEDPDGLCLVLGDVPSRPPGSMVFCGQGSPLPSGTVELSIC